MVVHELFPTVVGEYRVGRSFTEKEKNVFRSVTEMTHNVGNLNSVDKSVLDKRDLRSIKEKITESVQDYIDTIYRPISKVSPYITQSWINYTNENQWHHKHNHNNSFLSGVLYIYADSSIDKITFHDDTYNQVNIVPNEYNRLNSQSFDIGVGTGDIFIFPSRLTHEVKVSSNKNPRISLSFNTFIKGCIGQRDYMTELTLK